MEASIIQSTGLSKRYGKFTAVDDLSLEVPAGSIYGFVGPNGAGKTTTMRMLTTLSRPSEGEAWVAGQSIHHNRREVRRAIGYMPDEFGVYDDLRVWEYLDFFAACYDIPESERRPLVSDLLELVDLAHRREDMVDQLSRGMKQRLSLARTLAHDPKVAHPGRASFRSGSARARRSPRVAGYPGQHGQDGLLLHAYPRRRERDLQPHRHHRGGQDDHPGQHE